MNVRIHYISKMIFFNSLISEKIILKQFLTLQIGISLGMFKIKIDLQWKC